MIVVSPMMAFIGFVGAVASANACGMFGDGCSEYGQTGDGFGAMVVLFLASFPTFLGGLVVVARSRRSGSVR